MAALSLILLFIALACLFAWGHHRDARESGWAVLAATYPRPEVLEKAAFIPVRCCWIGGRKFINRIELRVETTGLALRALPAWFGFPAVLIPWSAIQNPHKVEDWDGTAYLEFEVEETARPIILKLPISKLAGAPLLDFK